MTGSAIALPLLAATGASAASGTTWDKVAECESGGSWSGDSGNGFYGGLQLTQADWEKYGGLAYATSADLASRSQQIAVGEKILADQGPEAWGACAPLAGLGKDTGSAGVDTGVIGGVVGAVQGGASGLGLGSNPGSNPGSGSGSGSASASPASPSPSSTASPGSSSSPSASPSPSGAPSGGSSAPGKAAGSSSGKPSGGAKGGSGKSAGPGRPGGSPSSSSPSPSVPGVGNSKEKGNSPVVVEEGGQLGNYRQSAENEGTATGADSSAGTGRHRGQPEGSYTATIGDALWSVTDSLDLAGGQSDSPDETGSFLDADTGLILPGQTPALGG
ncbi:transglycosylase family protein [Streptomyces graminilatus]|uniref:transglycosylase family protein n=1 Tax=Streptomyces graminilatus TaxID=1464070 RepID=UPI0018E2B54F|nr:transglycosylase family protein [Streptomyces graminilatus]